MKFASLDHFGLSAWRVMAVGLAASSASWLLADLAFGDALGGASMLVLTIVAAAVFYIVVTTPRRLLDRERVRQAKEAVLLASSSKALLEVTRSRSRSVLLLRPRDRDVAAAVARASKMILLGGSVARSVGAASGSLASYAVAAALRGLAKPRKSGPDPDDEEARGLAGSAALSRETKVPMIMTVSFFTPIMLLLYAVLSHSYGAVRLTELAAVELAVLDLAFHLGAPGGPG
ncbi:MAG: hypothetical protein JRN56_03190 [Nitrososphaerota archaeon]|nr:hypothetical protein [Nitrososphaerota archaeon]